MYIEYYKYLLSWIYENRISFQKIFRSVLINDENCSAASAVDGAAALLPHYRSTYTNSFLQKLVKRHEKPLLHGLHIIRRNSLEFCCWFENFKGYLWSSTQLNASVKNSALLLPVWDFCGSLVAYPAPFFAGSIISASLYSRPRRFNEFCVLFCSLQALFANAMWKC